MLSKFVFGLSVSCVSGLTLGKNDGAETAETVTTPTTAFKTPEGCWPGFQNNILCFGCYCAKEDASMFAELKDETNSGCNAVTGIKSNTAKLHDVVGMPKVGCCSGNKYFPKKTLDTMDAENTVFQSHDVDDKGKPAAKVPNGLVAATEPVSAVKCTDKKTCALQIAGQKCAKDAKLAADGKTLEITTLKGVKDEDVTKDKVKCYNTATKGDVALKTIVKKDEGIHTVTFDGDDNQPAGTYSFYFPSA